MLYSNIVLMLNLCVKKFCLCTWQTLLVQTVILLSDQSCDRENVEYKSQKIIAIFIFCNGSSDKKKRLTCKWQWIWRFWGNNSMIPNLLLTSYHLLLQLNDLLLSLSSQTKWHQGAEEHKERHPWYVLEVIGEGKQSVQVIFQVMEIAK